MNKAKINDWLYVGNHHSCPDPEHEMAIHIFRTDVSENQRRSCVHPDNRHNMSMNYKDGAIIDSSNLKNLDAVVTMLKERKRSTLVHCHAGMCRSPTVAIYLLCFVDGMNPYDAQHLVTKQIYDQRSGEICHINFDPLKQIIKLWEGRSK